MSAVVVLGVSRSGTTLLKAMLDAHSQLAIPSESYFLPQLWDRHGERPDRDAFLERPRAGSSALREWGVDPAARRARLPDRADLRQAMQAVYRSTPSRRASSATGTRRRSTCSTSTCSTARVPGRALRAHRPRRARRCRLAARDDAQAALQPLAPARRRRLRGRLADVRCGGAQAFGRYPPVPRAPLRGPRRAAGVASPRGLRVPRARVRARHARVPPPRGSGPLRRPSAAGAAARPRRALLAKGDARPRTRRSSRRSRATS